MDADRTLRFGDVIRFRFASRMVTAFVIVSLTEQDSYVLTDEMTAAGGCVGSGVLLYVLSHPDPSSPYYPEGGTATLGTGYYDVLYEVLE